MQFVLFAIVSIETKSNCSNLLFSILNVPFSTSYYILKICIIFWMWVSESHSVMFNSLGPQGLYSPWNSPGQNTRVGSLFLLQGIFPTQGSNPGLPHWGQILYQLSHKGSPRILEWVAYPFSKWSSQSRNRTGVSCIAGAFFTNWAIREILFLSFFFFSFYYISFKLHKSWIISYSQARNNFSFEFSVGRLWSLSFSSTYLILYKVELF